VWQGRACRSFWPFLLAALLLSLTPDATPDNPGRFVQVYEYKRVTWKPKKNKKVKKNYIQKNSP
jgi:hypothetical protein